MSTVNLTRVTSGKDWEREREGGKVGEEDGFRPNEKKRKTPLPKIPHSWATTKNKHVATKCTRKIMEAS